MGTDYLHEQIFDAIRDPLVVMDGEGAVYAVNAAALRLLDLGEGDAIEAGSVRLDVDVAELVERVRTRQRIQSLPVSDRAGRPTGIMVDIDPAVGPEGHSLLHFRGRMQSLARELWTDDAVATVAHEFRSPLAAMRSALNLVVSGEAGPLTDAQLRFMEAVRRGAGRLARIVDGYLDLARVRAGVLVMERREHDVRSLVAGITHDLSLCHPALAERLDVRIADSAGAVYADSDRIAQVLLNLAYNAARFTPAEKRLVVRVDPAGRESLDDDLRLLPFDVMGEPRLVCIEVEDEGIGMSADVLEHIFERYRDEPRHAENAGAGAHLGLHIARALVDAHEGCLRIESRLGEGTTARVFLPADERTARLLSRVRGAEATVQRLRAARRATTVALIAADAIRLDADAALWPQGWMVNPARQTDTGGTDMVWVLRDALALHVTTRDVAPVTRATGDHGARATVTAGACRLDDGMTFSGALRTAAASLSEQKTVRDVRAVPGLEPVCE